MATIYFGILLCISIGVMVYMAQKNYENIDIYYWTIVILVPIIILGYWLKTRVTTVDGALVAFSFIYLDSTVMLMIMLFSMFRFLGIVVKPWVKIVSYTATMAHLLMVWICFDNDLYYKSVKLINTAGGTVTKMESGPLKIFHWIYLGLIMFAIIFVLIMAFVRKGTYSRRTLATYTFLTISGLSLYVFEMLVDVDFSYLPILYVIADLIIAVDYDHAHTHDIASLISEQQKYNGARGYVAFDLKGRYLSSNQKSADFLPELSQIIVDRKLKNETRLASIFYELIEDFKEGKGNQKNFSVGKAICRAEISEFSIRRDGKIQGYLFDLRDVTKEQEMLNVIKDYNDVLNKEVEKQTKNIKNIQEGVVIGLANMVENRDNNTGGHVKRTSDIIKILVEEIVKQGVFDIDEKMATDIVRAAPMHDLGKITIDSSILLKPGRFTDEEYAIMKTHSVKSGEIVNIILKDVEENHFVDVAFNVARFHHERWDGKGYPEGLVGEMIPLEARIMAVADVYDALVSKRCYKDAMSFEEASDIMISGMGYQFDPNMLSIFVACKDKLEEYYSAREV